MTKQKYYAVFLLLPGRLFNEGSAISLHKLSEIFELFRISESSLSDDNNLRGFFLVPIIELLSELTEIFEADSAAETPGASGKTAAGVAGPPPVAWKASVDVCKRPKVFVDGVPPADAAGGGGGGCGGFFDFFGKNEGTPFLFLLPLDLKSSSEDVEEVFELGKFDKFAELFVEFPF